MNGDKRQINIYEIHSKINKHLESITGERYVPADISANEALKLPIRSWEPFT